MTDEQVAEFVEAFTKYLKGLQESVKKSGTRFVSNRHGFSVGDLTGAVTLMSAALDGIADAVRELAAAVDRHNVRST